MPSTVIVELSQSVADWAKAADAANTIAMAKKATHRTHLANVFMFLTPFLPIFDLCDQFSSYTNIIVDLRKKVN